MSSIIGAYLSRLGHEFTTHDRLDITKSTKSWLEQKIRDRREEQTSTIAALKILNKEIQKSDCSGIRLLMIWEWFKENNARGTMITYLSKKSDSDQDDLVSCMRAALRTLFVLHMFTLIEPSWGPRDTWDLPIDEEHCSADTAKAFATFARSYKIQNARSFLRQAMKERKAYRGKGAKHTDYLLAVDFHRATQLMDPGKFTDKKATEVVESDGDEEIDEQRPTKRMKTMQTRSTTKARETSTVTDANGDLSTQKGAVAKMQDLKVYLTQWENSLKSELSSLQDKVAEEKTRLTCARKADKEQRDALTAIEKRHEQHQQISALSGMAFDLRDSSDHEFIKAVEMIRAQDSIVKRKVGDLHRELETATEDCKRSTAVVAGNEKTLQELEKEVEKVELTIAGVDGDILTVSAMAERWMQG